MSIESNIVWKKSGEGWVLTNGANRLVSLGKSQGKTRNFILEGKYFQIGYESFFKSKWYVKTLNGTGILELKFAFFRSKGKIHFQDGAVYECHIHSDPNFTISIRDLRYGDELMTYRVVTSKNGEVHKDLVLHQNEIFTDKLLFLLTLGMCLTLHYHANELDLGTFLTLCTA